uniref:Uncharacterized protein n=1 Tax=Strongyloides venezuelensis TaxID=75913 RepID=A0A0K0FPX6_STRVS
MICKNLEHVTLFLIFVVFASHYIQARSGKDNLIQNHLTKKTTAKQAAAELGANNLQASGTKISIYKLDKAAKKSSLHKKQNKKGSVHKKQPKTQDKKRSVHKKSFSKPAHKKVTSNVKSKKEEEDE